MGNRQFILVQIAVSKEEALFKKKHTAFFHHSQVYFFLCFIYHPYPAQSLNSHSISHSTKEGFVPNLHLSVCYTLWGCSVWLLSVALLLSAPAEIKAFCTVHIGMPWHMSESEHNMYGLLLSLCVRHAVIGVFNWLFICALLWGFVDAWQHMFLLWVCASKYLRCECHCASIRVCLWKLTCI